jgi:hypothetical protein
MTQISSSATLLSRPPGSGADASSEPRTEPVEGFADLLAVLLGVAPPARAEPVRQVAPKMAGSTAPNSGETAGDPPDGDRPSGPLQQVAGGVSRAAIGNGQPAAAGPESLPAAELPETELAENAQLPGVKPAGALRGDANAPAASASAADNAAAARADATLPGEQHRPAPRPGGGPAVSRPMAAPAPVGGSATTERNAGQIQTASAELAAAGSGAVPLATPGYSSPTYLVAGRLALAEITPKGGGFDSADLPIGSGIAATDGGLAISSAERLATAAPAAAAAMRPATQIAAAIERAVNGELRQLTVQLNPRELGTIEIALEIDADRRLGIAILVERPETLDLLRQEARQLERLLAQQGIDLGDAGLELGLMSQERREGGHPPPAADMQLALADAAAAPEGDPQPSVRLDDPLSAHRVNLSI